MGAEIRKLVTITEEIRAELGRPVEVPVRRSHCAEAAVGAAQ